MWSRSMTRRRYGTSIADYGLIGNLHTAALISRIGSVDWACLPRFASPSVFARILDSDRGGFQQVTPAEEYTSVQHYRPSTCVLETRFRLTRHRALRITDFMPIAPGVRPETSPMVLRMLEAEGGDIVVSTRFAPRFGYGRHLPDWKFRSAGVEALHDSDRLQYRHPWPLNLEGGLAEGRGRLTSSERVHIEMIWGSRRPSPADPETLLRETEKFWREWVHTPGSRFHRVAHRWHRWVERSELTLKLLSHERTGAFVAAPTTSIPEWPGGSRNWDYRYVWIRDGAFACQAMVHLGHRVEARGFLDWVFRILDHDPEHRLHVMYGAHGETDLRERSIPWLHGLWDSRPVRVGNQAYRQFQLDIYGELLESALILFEVDPSFVRGHWGTIARLADQVLLRWRHPDRGIWEVRGPPAHFVHSKLMAWVALDRAARLGLRYGDAAGTRQWTEEAAKVRAWILRNGYDERIKSFRRSKSDSQADAANLRIPLLGFLPFDDPRVVGTVDRIRRELADGPFVYRYRADDGVPGSEGAFLPASFWLVECLARQGEKSIARNLWRRLLQAGSPLDLFSEEYDPRGKQLLGNFPQALTHIGILRAATALGEVGSRALY